MVLPKSFSTGVKALRTLNDGTCLIQIQGIKSAASADEMDLLVYAPNEISVGDYIEGDQATYYILGVYAPQNRADELRIYFGGFNLMRQRLLKLKLPG